MKSIGVSFLLVCISPTHTPMVYLNPFLLLPLSSVFHLFDPIKVKIQKNRQVTPFLSRIYPRDKDGDFKRGSLLHVKSLFCIIRAKKIPISFAFQTLSYLQFSISLFFVMREHACIYFHYSNAISLKAKKILKKPRDNLSVSGQNPF